MIWGYIFSAVIGGLSVFLAFMSYPKYEHWRFELPDPPCDLVEAVMRSYNDRMEEIFKVSNAEEWQMDSAKYAWKHSLEDVLELDKKRTELTGLVERYETKRDQFDRFRKQGRHWIILICSLVVYTIVGDYYGFNLYQVATYLAAAAVVGIVPLIFPKIYSPKMVFKTDAHPKTTYSDNVTIEAYKIYIDSELNRIEYDIESNQKEMKKAMENSNFLFWGSIICLLMLLISCIL